MGVGEGRCVDGFLVSEHSVRLCSGLFKDQAVKDKALQSMAAMSSAQIVSATTIQHKLGLPGIPRPSFQAAPGVSDVASFPGVALNYNLPCCCCSSLGRHSGAAVKFIRYGTRIRPFGLSSPLNHC